MLTPKLNALIIWLDSLDTGARERTASVPSASGHIPILRAAHSLYGETIENAIKLTGRTLWATHDPLTRSSQISLGNLAPGPEQLLKGSISTRCLPVRRTTETFISFAGVGFVRLCNSNTLLVVSDLELHTGFTAHTQFHGRLTSSPRFICPPSLALTPIATLLEVASSNLSSLCKMTYYGDNAPQLAGSVITLAVIAYIVFGLRMYTRIRNASFGVDDWCMVLATVRPHTPLLDLTEEADNPDTFYGIDRFMHWWFV